MAKIKNENELYQVRIKREARNRFPGPTCLFWEKCDMSGVLVPLNLEKCSVKDYDGCFLNPKNEVPVPGK